MHHTPILFCRFGPPVRVHWRLWAHNTCCANPSPSGPRGTTNTPASALHPFCVQPCDPGGLLLLFSAPTPFAESVVYVMYNCIAFLRYFVLLIKNYNYFSSAKCYHHHHHLATAECRCEGSRSIRSCQVWCPVWNPAEQRAGSVATLYDGHWGWGSWPRHLLPRSSGYKGFCSHPPLYPQSSTGVCWNFFGLV